MLKLNHIAQVSSIVPVIFSSGGTDRIQDIVDRKGEFIGIKRMSILGRTGFPEKIPTDVYIWRQHFFELNDLLNNMIEVESLRPGITKKWFKYIECIWERDMYGRKSPHTDVYSEDCNKCRGYANQLVDKAIWWFNLGTDRFVRMTFRSSSNDIKTFKCCIFWIKITGLFEVELKVQSNLEEAGLMRNFRVVGNQ